MLITITYEGKNTQELGYLLHKNPNSAQEFELTFGKAYVFYPEVTNKRTTAALVLDINSVDLAKGKENSPNTGLFTYVNDRPYTCNSFMSVALNRVFGTAMKGRCDKKQELADTPIDLTAAVYMLRCESDEDARNIFEPLGYEVNIERGMLDERFHEWGKSPYINITLKGKVRLAELLNHLYVLIPFFDGNKHYYIDDSEVEKLLSHGGEWLKNHPYRETIVRGYFNNIHSITKSALTQLADDEDSENDSPKHKRLDTERIDTVAQVVLDSGAKTVLDLGCGEGKYAARLAAEPQIVRITEADVAVKILGAAKARVEKLPQFQRDKVDFIQASALCRDRRFESYDCCLLIEVIEHIDEERLPVLERVLFEFAHPKTVIVTTPNAEYNSNYQFLPDGELRHDDHRFEWNREKFSKWAESVCEKYGYKVKITGIGNEDGNLGAPTQMGVFEL
ncbi:MAG: 3' terminal RNA ribose 2'-O-methyltransferase Hen1 [Ruminococcus sp.]|nr:3' terminal RNA ribose 2'-O-methyltransferase Hen1 [Ruminococcus sp.]